MARLTNWWKGISPRERMLVGAALLVGIIFVGVNYVFDPVYATYEQKRDQLDAREQLLKKYEHLAQTADKARQKLKRISTLEQAINQGLLAETNPDLANAELQGVVKELAKKAEIKFTRITPSKPEVENGFMMITLKLPFNGTIKQISKFLYELETAPQFFDISSLTIRTRRRDKRMLRVELEITAFIKAPEESANEENGSDNA